jgi:hypothetical protein
MYQHFRTLSVQECKQEEFFQLTPPMEMEQTQCSVTLALKIQMPENHPEERIQHSGHGKSLKSRIILGRWYSLSWSKISELKFHYCEKRLPSYLLM